MARSLEITVAPTCISSGYCRNSAPGVFAAAADRKALVLSNPVADSPDVWEALEGCPVEALSAVDASSGAHVFP